MMLAYDAGFASEAQAQLLRNAELPKIPLHDVEGRRERFRSLLNKEDSKIKLPDDVEHLIHHANAHDGHSIPIHHFRKTRTKIGSSLDPAIVHMHGGGFFAFRAIDFAEGMAKLTRATGVTIFSVDYRLAPENAYPIPLEDCWQALLWVQSRADVLGIDTQRLAIMGESAGGGLAAGLALIARDRHLQPPIAKQILVYPMIDCRKKTDHTGGLVIWTADDDATGWAAYLGTDPDSASSPYAIPARSDTVAGLPRLYLECTQLDILVHESVEYAQRFVKANIPTEFHVYEGLPHGFSSLAPTCEATQRANANRLRAMTTF